MDTLDPVISYFEVKARNIVYKYSGFENTLSNTPLKIESFHSKLQKMEQELDIEINDILNDNAHSNACSSESLIKEIFFYREKARLEFVQLNHPAHF